MRKWWRKYPRLVGNTAHWLLRSLRFTLRIKVHKHPAIDSTQPYVFAFWHGKQLLPSFLLMQHHDTPMCALVSPSRDGGLLTVYLRKAGFDVVRGSSRDNNIAGLINIRRKLRQGASIGSGLDGPLGPMHVAKPGLVFLAQKCAVPVIPMGCAFNRAWTFKKAWDKFQLPKPFAKAGLVLGQPYFVAKDMDIDAACVELGQILQQTEQQAMDLINR